VGVVVLKTTDGVFYVVVHRSMVMHLGLLSHPGILKPKNSSTEPYRLQADEQAYGRLHHPRTHIHIRPRRNPHMRLDKRMRFSSPTAAMPTLTKSFCFGSR
jgi:hypothetical protein